MARRVSVVMGTAMVPHPGAERRRRGAGHQPAGRCTVPALGRILPPDPAPHEARIDVLTRRPAPGPLAGIALEVALTLSCAFLVGLLLWLSVGACQERDVPGVVIGVPLVVAVAVGVGWFLWLTEAGGLLLAGASAAAGLQIAFLLVLGATGAT